MTNTTLSTALNHGITVAFGSPTYRAPFTITATGSVNGGTSGDGVNLNSGRLVNDGSISGEIGAYGGMGTFIDNANHIAGIEFGVEINSMDMPSLGNTGVITGGTGVDMVQGGFVTNSSTGIIIGGTYGVSDLNADNSGLSLTNAGLVTGAVAGVIALEGMSNQILNSGTIIGGAVGIELEEINAITIENSGTIASGEGAAGYAIEEGFTPDQMHLIVDPGAVFVGTVQLGSQVLSAAFDDIILNTGTGHGTISGIGTQFIGEREITITANAAWDITGNAAGFLGQTISGNANFTPAPTIAGFSDADTIDITGLNIVADDYNESTGLLQLYTVGSSGNSLAGTMVVHMQTPEATDTVMVSSDGHGGTEITTNAICYLRGTRILTAEGEKAVEDIKAGDLVPTRFGGLQAISWVGIQSYARRFVENNRNKTPVRITTGALGAGLPKRDLSVSPGHSMLLGDVLVLARHLVNGITITQDFVPETVEYFNFEFDAGHDCVLAEGSWSESFADGPGLRAQFHNAAEFLAAHPDYVAPEVQAELCASRPETGPVLEFALAPVLARAGAFLQVASKGPGEVEGWVDVLTTDHVSGWAIDVQNRELPVQLDILDGDVVIGSVMALDYRGDLAEAGKGAGRCAFSFTLPGGIIQHGITVRRVGDVDGLPMSDNCRVKLAA